MAIRRKRKADSFHLNLVKDVAGSRDVRIERVSVPVTSCTTSSTCIPSARVSALPAEHETGGDQPANTSSFSGRLGEDDDDTFVGEDGMDLETEGLTPYQARTLKAAEAWGASRSAILRSVVECSSLPKGVCHHCNEAPSAVSCKQCGPQAYYCVVCALKLHATQCFLHSPLFWDVS